MEVKIEAELKDIKQVLTALEVEIPKINKKILGAIGTQLKSKIKGSYSGYLKKQGGKLFSGIMRVVKSDGSSVSVYSPASYWGVRYGFVLAAGAKILPKKGKYLVFKIGDTWIKSKGVEIRARPWVRDPGESYINSGKMGTTIETTLQKELKKVMK